ncbi:MAG TPA: flagellin, partial [Chitinispirillaceae bacterium]|nr:flagellin [Chitinispirillaceae bacterium]
LINRMEHAINNLLVSNSNQQSAESTIRDVDFAQETTRFTRNQILTQSATAMLSQANMIPQSTLQLLGA